MFTSIDSLKRAVPSQKMPEGGGGGWGPKPVVKRKEMLLYHDFTQFLDDIVQSWVCLVNIEKRLLFNVKQEQLAVFGNLMFPKIPVMYDPSRYYMLFVLVTFKAVITGIVCANFELSINHAYKTNRQYYLLE